MSDTWQKEDPNPKLWYQTTCANAKREAYWSSMSVHSLDIKITNSLSCAQALR
jgi:hypothetical protein